ncbi:hypothetical protein ACFFMN_43420, partial [Planobispora siamensis]|uniref:hypothetical protein n=1 Tax=Planobispora siamensis TaxID=936338 RepID=UPI0035E97319
MDDYKNAVKELLELSPPGGDFGSAYNLHGLPINDSRLHYGFLVATLDVISEALSVLCPPSYESEYFPAVRKAVAATLESTSSIGNQLSLVLTVVDGNLQNALELVEEKCGQGQDDCDQAVRDAVDADSEKYAQALDLLQLVGRASE